MTYFIKNFGIVLSCLYYYKKILSLKNNKYQLVFSLVFSLCLSIVLSFTDFYYPHITMPILLLLTFIFICFLSKENLSVTFTTVTISFSMSYTLFIIASIISTTITLFFPEYIIHKYRQLLTCVLQLSMAPIPFCFKRTKHGMPFLKTTFYSLWCTIVCFFVLAISILFNINNYNFLYTLLIISIPFIVIIIYVYWNKYLTKTYIDKLNLNNIESLNTELLEKQKYIELLENDNRQLSKIIHKDNKLIPAMEYAVETYIKETGLTETDHQRGVELLTELHTLSKERKGILTLQDNACQSMVSCGLTRIDSLLQYVQIKAQESGITLNYTLEYNIQNLISTVISEEKLCTLLADLLENAIIATRHNKGKHILLNFSMLSKNYAIHIFDSGIPFTKEVLSALGQKAITTHADESGSGIGLMQTYEILHQTSASLTIDEFTPDTGQYTKKISIVFNKRNQYILYTTRTEEEIRYLNERTDLNIVRK